MASPKQRVNLTARRKDSGAHNAKLSSRIDEIFDVWRTVMVHHKTLLRSLEQLPIDHTKRPQLEAELESYEQGIVKAGARGLDTMRSLYEKRRIVSVKTCVANLSRWFSLWDVHQHADFASFMLSQPSLSLSVPIYATLLASDEPTLLAALHDDAVATIRKTDGPQKAAIKAVSLVYEGDPRSLERRLEKVELETIFHARVEKIE